MIKDFIDEDTGYVTFMEKMYSTIGNSDSEQYNKDIFNRVLTTLDNSLLSLKEAMETLGGMSIDHLDNFQKLLDEKGATYCVIPVHVKVICLYTESIIEEIEKLEIGESRNVTPSETIMRMLHHIEEEEQRTTKRDVSMYDYRILTEDSEFDIQRYKGETVITKIK